MKFNKNFPHINKNHKFIYYIRKDIGHQSPGKKKDVTEDFKEFENPSLDEY